MKKSCCFFSHRIHYLSFFTLSFVARISHNSGMFITFLLTLMLSGQLYVLIPGWRQKAFTQWNVDIFEGNQNTILGCVCSLFISTFAYCVLVDKIFNRKLKGDGKAISTLANVTILILVSRRKKNKCKLCSKFAYMYPEVLEYFFNSWIVILLFFVTIRISPTRVLVMFFIVDMGIRIHFYLKNKLKQESKIWAYEGTRVVTFNETNDTLLSHRP